MSSNEEIQNTQEEKNIEKEDVINKIDHINKLFIEENQKQKTKINSLVTELNESKVKVKRIIDEGIIPLQNKLEQNNKKLLELLQIGSDNQVGGGTKKRKKYFFDKYNKENLYELGEEWGIKNIKKYKNRKELLTGLRVLLNYKGIVQNGGKCMKIRHLQQLSENLDIMDVSKYNKNELMKKIKYKIRNI